jgi:hypothetical protein
MLLSGYCYCTNIVTSNTNEVNDIYFNVIHAIYLSNAAEQKIVGIAFTIDNQ